MKTPSLSSGMTGFTDENGRFVCTGSAMGRCSSRPGPCTPGAKFTLTRVRIDAGGYDYAGAYWGKGPPLYRAFSDEGDGEETQELFMRADDREDAKRQTVERFPGATFYR
jgi:hypothetical protein